MSFRFWKKPWEREPCLFEVQEIGPGGKGWVSITEPSAKKTSRKEAEEHFTPGKTYRLLARSIERGAFVGVVWTYYHPHPKGTIKKVTERKEKAEPKPQKLDAKTYMKEYAQQVADTLEPISLLLEAIRGFTDSLVPSTQAPPPQPQALVGQLQFDGRAPWMMHPVVVQQITESVTQVVDHVADRFGLPRASAERETEEEGDEDFGLPSARDYVTTQPEPSAKEPIMSKLPKTVAKTISIREVPPQETSETDEMLKKVLKPPEKNDSFLKKKTRKEGKEKPVADSQTSTPSSTLPTPKGNDKDEQKTSKSK